MEQTQAVISPSTPDESVLSSRQTKQAIGIMEHIVQSLPSYMVGLEFVDFLARTLASLDDRAIEALRSFFIGILMRMRELEASDIDIGSHGTGGNIWLRIHGAKKPQAELPSLPNRMADVLILAVLTQKQREVLIKYRSIDFSFHTESEDTIYRYRGNAYFDLEGLAMNMRAITASIRPYAGYGFHPIVTGMVNLEHTKEGLVLVTGITGSGKSTTLDAIIDANNHAVDAHIIIIGSPIEYVHSPVRCVIRHREVGRDVLSFKDGIVQALRQDPDIIVIGEMRDPETIMSALEITDSGHKVFSTLHTSAAVESIDRIIGEVPPIEQDRVRNRLADVLRCVISQKLIPTLDGRRTLAKEVLVVIPSVRAAIKNGNTSEIYQMIHEGAAFGMHTMEQDLNKLYRQGKISAEEAMNHANNKKRVQQLLTTK
jgi:twitching motility protein PilT